jgi:hypothetical protein
MPRGGDGAGSPEKQDSDECPGDPVSGEFDLGPAGGERSGESAIVRDPDGHAVQLVE